MPERESRRPEPGENLERVLSASITMFRTRSTNEIASLLDPGVVWQGVLPDQRCEGADAVLALMDRNQAQRPPRLTRVDAREFGQRVLVSVEGPDFPENGPLQAGSPRTLVFTFRDGRIGRIDSCASLEAGLALASS
jgi:SnoaL-like domain